MANEKGLLAALIERRLGGYRQQHNEVDPSRPERPEDRRKVSVAVVGAGIAGLTAAAALSRRRFDVTVYEKNDYLGGKIGSWPVQLSDGSRAQVEHGFHAFFRQYYNLNEWLGRIGALERMVPISDYAIVTADGRSFGFERVRRTPVVNMVSMAKTGIYKLGEVAANPKSSRMLEFLKYHPVRTYELFDEISYQSFAEEIELSSELRLVFNTFSRAFFADADRMSMAELIKSFHSYFLSNDEGLIYDYPDDDYEVTILSPARRYLEDHGAGLMTGTPVETLERHGDRWKIRGESYDAVILAADVRGIREIARQSDALGEPSSGPRSRLMNLAVSQRYAVLRFWTRERVPWGLPAFVITEKKNVLDSVSVYHELEKSSADWAARTGGGVYELHCYAVPDEMTEPDTVKQHFLRELYDAFPRFREASIVDEHMQLRDDFTAFHTGLRSTRPGVNSGLPGLFLAGDWVRLPVPSMLMETACTSGLMAANAILGENGLREEPVYTVPPVGLLAPRLREEDGEPMEHAG